MTDHVELPHVADPWDSYPAACRPAARPGPAWSRWGVILGTMDAPRRRREAVLIRCPAGHCSEIAGERSAHVIQADGTVVGSFVCPWPVGEASICGWHVTLRLLDWQERA